MAELERLYVRVLGDVTDLHRNLSKAERRLEQFGYDMARAGKALTVGLTVPLAAAGVAATKLASDAVEAANKFDVVFGASAARARDRIEELHSVIPATRHEMEGISASLQDMLVPMGLARARAADLSVQFLELGADLASFNNIPIERAMMAVRSGLAGESEPLRRYGVDVREARLQTLALTEGLTKAGEAMDRTARAEAVFLAITQDSKDAIGDAARTAHEAANQFRFFWRNIKELGVTIGNELLPVVTPLVRSLNELITAAGGLRSPTVQWGIAVGVVAASLGPLLFLGGKLLRLIVLLRPAIIGLATTLGVSTGGLGFVVAAAATGLGLLATRLVKNRIEAAAAAAAYKDAAESIREMDANATAAALNRAREEEAAAVRRAQALQYDIRHPGATTVPRERLESQFKAAFAEVLRLRRELSLLEEHARDLQTLPGVTSAAGGGASGGGLLGGAVNIAHLELGRVLERVERLRERLIELRHDEAFARTADDAARIREEIAATGVELDRAADAAARLSANLPTPIARLADSGAGAIAKASSEFQQMLQWAMATGGFDAAKIAELRGQAGAARGVGAIATAGAYAPGPMGTLLSGVGNIGAAFAFGGPLMGGITAVGEAFRGLTGILGGTVSTVERFRQSLERAMANLRAEFEVFDTEDPLEQFNRILEATVARLPEHLQHWLEGLTPENLEERFREFLDVMPSEDIARVRPDLWAWYTMLRDTFVELDRLGDQAEAAARGLGDLSRILNAPTGFGINWFRDRIASAGLGGGGGLTPNQPTVEPGGGGITIGEVTIVARGDPRETWEEFKRALRYGRRSGDIDRDGGLAGAV